MPTQIFQAYRAYLKKYIQEANLLQEKLILTRLSYLEALSNSDFQYYSPLLDICRQLQTCPVALPKMISGASAEPLPTQALSNDVFMKFHNTIYQAGSDEEKKRFVQLKWFKAGNGINTHALTDKKSICLVPLSLLNEVPRQDTFFTFIFVGQHLRHTFFKERFLLLAQLKHIPVFEFTAFNIRKTECEKPNLHVWQEKQKLIENALFDLRTNYFNKVSSYFLRKTKTFLQIWECELLNLRESIIEQKLRLAETLLSELLAKKPSNTVAWQPCDLLENVLNQLEEDLKSYPHLKSAEHTRRWQTCRDKAVGIISTHKANAIMSYLSEGKAIENNEAAYLIDFYKNTQLYDNNQAIEFQTYHEIAIDLLLDHLKLCLKFPFADSNFIKDLKLTLQRFDHIHHLITTIKTIGNVAQQDKLKDIINKKIQGYFLNYLRLLLHLAANRNAFIKQCELFNSVESVLLNFGDTVLFAGKSLKEHTSELKEYREQSEISLVQAHAEALAITLANIHFERSLDKDSGLFDHQIFESIQANPELNYNDNAMEVLRRIKNKMLLKGTENVRDIQNELSSSEQGLVGLSEKGNRYYQSIPELLAMTIKVAQANFIIKQEEDIKVKTSKAKDLAKSMQKILQNNLITANDNNVMRNKSKKRLLFCKHNFNSLILDINHNNYHHN